MARLFLFSVFLLLVAGLLDTLAQEAVPVPRSAQDGLAGNLPEPAGDLQSARARLAEQATRLAARADATAAELAGLRTALVAVSGDIVAGFNALEALDQEIAELDLQRQDSALALETLEVKAMNAAIARARIEASPPINALASPLAPQEAAQAQIILETLGETLDQQSRILALALAEYERVQTALLDRRSQLEEETADLAQEMESLDRLLENRRQLLSATEAERDEVTQALEILSQRVNDTSELVASLAAPLPPASQPDADPAADLADLERDLADQQRRPVQATAGDIVIGFGSQGPGSGRSNGLWIDAPPGAPVVAPLGGTVRFAGEFRGMGQMVILEHTPQFHTLVGRMGIISVDLGQSVITGEPIGRTGLPQDRHGDRANLYLEVRRGAAPVDPTVGLADAYTARMAPQTSSSHLPVGESAAPENN